jgi:hypothetical protein
MSCGVKIGKTACVFAGIVVFSANKEEITAKIKKKEKNTNFS